MIEIKLSTSNQSIGKYFPPFGKFYENVYYRDDIRSDRPMSCEGQSYYILNDIIHRWLVEHNIFYSIREDNGVTIISFDNKKDAILFKLIWM